MAMTSFYSTERQSPPPQKYSSDRDNGDMIVPCGYQLEFGRLAAKRVVARVLVPSLNRREIYHRQSRHYIFFPHCDISLTAFDHFVISLYLITNLRSSNKYIPDPTVLETNPISCLFHAARK